MNNLMLLKNFIAIVDQGGFSKAADYLHQSNPSTSRQLNELEDELQQVLIQRNTRSFVLTEFGEIYYQRAKDLLKQYNDLSKIRDIYNDNPSGTLKIVGQLYPINQYILPKLRGFCSKYPQIIPDIEVTVRPPTMHKEDVDITITIDTLMENDQRNTDNIIKRYLYDTEIIFCCSKDYLKSKGILTNIKELKDHTYITNSSRLYPKQLTLKDNIIIDIEPSVYVNNTPAMILCAKNSIGIIQVVRDAVIDELNHGTLVQILPDLTFTQKVYIYYKKVKFVEPKVRKFIEYVF